MATTQASHNVLPPIVGVRSADTSRTLRRWARRLLILAIVVAAVVVLRLTYFRPAPVPVSVARVKSGRVEDLITNNKNGTVTARTRPGLTPEVGGRIARLPVW